jgi:hypothetical protein
MQQVDMKIEGLRAGIGAAGVTVYGMTLNEWVAIVTLIYLTVQILILLPKVCTTVKRFVERGRGDHEVDS